MKNWERNLGRGETWTGTWSYDGMIQDRRVKQAEGKAWVKIQGLHIRVHVKSCEGTGIERGRGGKKQCMRGEKRLEILNWDEILRATYACLSLHFRLSATENMWEAAWHCVQLPTALHHFSTVWAGKLFFSESVPSSVKMTKDQTSLGCWRWKYKCLSYSKYSINTGSCTVMGDFWWGEWHRSCFGSH